MKKKRFIIMPRWHGAAMRSSVARTPEARGVSVLAVVSARRHELGSSANDLATALRDHGISEHIVLGPSMSSLSGQLGASIAASVAKVAGVGPDGQASLLGAVAIEVADQATADGIARDIPDFDVIRDVQLELIGPVRSSSDTRIAANPDWRWFHEHVDAHVAAAAGVKGKGIGVAILDTGVDSTHPELTGRIEAGVTFDIGAGTWTVTQGSSDTDTHGTHVAGIVGGKETGIAPGTKLYSATTIPAGRGWYSEFILALEWAATNPDIQIVNLSAGLQGYHPQMLEAVTSLKALDILPIIAIGNEGRNRTRSPGNYDSVLSVGATDSRRHVASFSGGGIMQPDAQQYTVPDVVAPGDGIRSCVPGDGYALLSGTSMAAPIVSGIAALLLERYPNTIASELESALLETAVDLQTAAARQGAGLISYVKAAAYLD